VCPPLCTMAEINNGTYTLADIELMNQTISEALEATIEARESANKNAR
jgi:hypothetical protein